MKPIFRRIFASVIAGGGGGVSFDDDFGRADGDLGNGWVYSAGKWTIASGKALGTPALGSELVLNGDLEGWASASNANNWTEAPTGTSTINQDTSDFHGGATSARIDVDASNSTCGMTQIAGTVNSWIQFSAWRKAQSGASGQLLYGTGEISDVFSNTTWAQRLQTLRVVNSTINLRRNSAASKSIWYDDISIKALTFVDTLCTRDFETNAPDVSVKITRTALYQSGLVLCMDDAVNPQNYVIVWETGAGRVVMDKVVSGTITNVLAATNITYAANAPLRVTKVGTTFKVFYNGTQVGTDKTISDAGIISNTVHGLFSTSSLNQFDDFELSGP